MSAAVALALLLAAGAQGRADRGAQTIVALELWVAPEGQVVVSEPSIEGTSSCDSGSGTVCRLTYQAPKRLELFALPTAPSQLHGWTAAECSGQVNPCVIQLTDDEPVVSVFALFDPARLTVRVSAPENDPSRVTGPGNISCTQLIEDTCTSEPLDTGELRVLTAHTTLSVQWLFGCDPVPTNPKECVARSENQIVGVKFGGAPGPDRPLEVEVTLRVAKVGAGNGFVSGSGFNCGSGDGCRRRFEFGELISFEATAAAGSRFAGWVGVCGEDRACRFNVGPVSSVQARFLPMQPPPPPPPPPPQPTPPPPPLPSRLTVRVTSVSAARAAGRWRVAARVVTNQRATARGRVGRGRRVWGDRNFVLRAGTNTLTMRLVPRATRGTCWFTLVARGGPGEVRTIRRSVRLGR
jgi:hypothetical protein